MVSNFHGKIVLTQGIHGFVSIEYDNATERLADENFVTEDRYKIAYQVDNGTFWCLVDETIPAWTQLNSALTSSVIQVPIPNLASLASSNVVVDVSGQFSTLDPILDHISATGQLWPHDGLITVAAAQITSSTEITFTVNNSSSVAFAAGPEDLNVYVIKTRS